MNGLKNRGVEDILIACVDDLNGFPQAIEAVYLKTEIQQCIIHQIRNSTKFVSYKDIKKLMIDLKLVYADMGRIRKMSLPICNYSQILYQFLTFIQKLKRSLSHTCIAWQYASYLSNIYSISLLSSSRSRYSS